MMLFSLRTMLRTAKSVIDGQNRVIALKQSWRGLWANDVLEQSKAVQFLSPPPVGTTAANLSVTLGLFLLSDVGGDTKTGGTSPAFQP